MIAAIIDYKNDKHWTEVDEKYLPLISFLEPVQQQLHEQIDDLYYNHHTSISINQLQGLVKYLKLFREQYNKKLYIKDHRKQVGEEILIKQLTQIYNNRIPTAFKKIKTKSAKLTHTNYFNHILQNPKYTTLTPRQYKASIKNYIEDNPAKYLALLIQAKDKLIQFPQDKKIDTHLDSDTIHEMLLNQGDYSIDPSKLMVTQDKILEIKDIQAALETIQQTESEQLTDAQKIIALLFLKDGKLKGSRQGTETELWNELIAKYQNSEQQEELYPYCHILSLLEKVAKQLITEAYDIKGDENKDALKERAKQIQKFIKVYNDTQKKPRTKIHNKNKTNQKESASKNTLTQALNKPDYIQEQPILRDDTVLKNLKDYIDNKPEKYLAALIQASYKLIQITNDIIKYPDITPNDIYGILLPCLYNQHIQIKFIDHQETKDNLTRQLRHILNIQGKGEGELTVADQIIKQLFLMSTHAYVQDNQARINNLTNLITKYNAQQYTEEGPVTVSILSLLRDIATQLEKDAAAFNESPDHKQLQNQLKDIAKQIRIFSEEYTRKEQEERIRREQEAEKKRQEEENKKKAEEARKAKEEAEQKAKEEEKKIKQLLEEINAYFNKNKEQGSKLSTTQKIINNLNATNKMFQIIKQILY